MVTQIPEPLEDPKERRREASGAYIRLRRHIHTELRPHTGLSVEHGSGCVLFFKISVCFLRPSLFSCFFTLPLVVPLQFVAPLRRACLATRLKAV